MLTVSFYPFLSVIFRCIHQNHILRATHHALPAHTEYCTTIIITFSPRRDSKAPVILQVSQGGAAFFGGKGLKNSAEKQEASVAGATAAAHYVRAIAPAYGVPVIMHSDHCAKKLLPWFDGMLDADEKYFKEHGEPLFS
jgi:fructose-bisphosphate aldolase class II